MSTLKMIKVTGDLVEEEVAEEVLSLEEVEAAVTILKWRVINQEYEETTKSSNSKGHSFSRTLTKLRIYRNRKSGIVAEENALWDKQIREI